MRCEICGYQTSCLTETIERRYSCRSNNLIRCCADCFAILVVDNYKELDEKVKKKLEGKE